MLLEPTDVPEPQLTIAVPSAGRAGRVLVAKMLPPKSFVVVVPEAEVAAYREAQPQLEVVGHPMAVSKLPLKRQWIYEQYGDVLMLDDDLDHVLHVEHGQGEKMCKLEPDEALEVFARTAWETAQMGAYLFGYGDADPRNYDDLHPWRLTGFVVGSAMGILAGSKLRFNGEVLAADDYWVSLLNAFEHRVALIDWRYCPNGPQGSTFKTVGGMGGQRTMSSEEKDFWTLRRYFGEAIQRKEDTYRAKRKHDWQKTMWLPYGS